MHSKFFYIAALIVLLAGLSWIQSNGQNQFAKNPGSNWSKIESDTLSNKILLSIESLKRAEANIEDSAVIIKLESLGYLSIANSGFTSFKKDKFQRAGWWMLSYPVAIKYGLKINHIIDERKDLIKSTLAASAYWLDLKKNLGSEEMADLYFLNSPIAMDKFYSDSVNFPNAYSEIKSMEATLIELKKIYELHRFNKFIGPTQPVSSVKSNQKISFEVIHHFTQISTKELEKLNPQWVSNVYDPQYGNLILPSGLQEKFYEQMELMQQKTRDDQIVLMVANEKRIKLLKGDIPDLERYKPIRYKVKMGDNLGRIAQRYHVKISSIRSWNELNSDRIYAGQRLTIYIPKNQKLSAPKPAAKKTKKSSLKPGEYQEYTVQKGDTLWGISQQFNKVSADTIMEDNGINENIAPGQVLKIRKIE